MPNTASYGELIEDPNLSTRDHDLKKNLIEEYKREYPWEHLKGLPERAIEKLKEAPLEKYSLENLNVLGLPEIDITRLNEAPFEKFYWKIPKEGSLENIKSIETRKREDVIRWMENSLDYRMLCYLGW